MRTCDVCKAKLRPNNTIGVCKGTPACQKEWRRRHRKHAMYDACACGERKAKSAKTCRACYDSAQEPQPYIKDGYRFVPVQYDHPRRYPKTGQTGWVREHILVMEQILGRYLLPGETVHHKNDIRSDNSPGNLQLRQGQHGPGAAFQCGSCGSHNIVAVGI